MTNPEPMVTDKKVIPDLQIENRFSHIEKLINRGGPFAGMGFEPDTAQEPNLKNILRQDYRILVVGAGGLGCEILKNLAYSGFKNFDCIDMDEIDYSNLNRQFLFRKDDVGKPKATVAAAFIKKRVPDVKCKGHYCKIQDKPEEFYQKFNLIIAGLDSIDARRWLNNLVINLVVLDKSTGDPDVDTIIPIVDGGTEGFKGQVRVLIPRLNSCIECTMELFPKQETYPMCTIANTPRKPEHCIQYVVVLAWDAKDSKKPFAPGTKIDGDNPKHIEWIHEQALARAKEHGIDEFDLRKTKGVVKNIIPAIASTNAIISAGCVNEAFKIATNTAETLDNYMAYNGGDGAYTFTFAYEQKPECFACGSNEYSINVPETATLEELIELIDDVLQLKKPTLRCNGKNIWYHQGPLAASTKGNLEKKLSDLSIKDGDQLAVSDPTVLNVVKVTLTFQAN